MRVHHLNCGTMRPLSGRMVCHALLLEAGDRLVLVDTGLGLGDIEAPAQRLGPYRHLVRPVLDPSETAHEQTIRRGFDPRDVTDIVLTHADFDHAGGLGDFPWASVHLGADEAEAMRRPRTALERRRVSLPQWSHRPRIVEHSPGEREWLGLGGAREILDGVLLVPLPGHTAGHSGVAVRTDDGWALHAGDAFGSPRLLSAGQEPLPVRLRQRVLAHDAAAMRRSQAGIAGVREQAQKRQVDLVVVNGHDLSLHQAAVGDH